MMMRSLLILLLFPIMLLAVEPPLKKMTLQLQWIYQFQFAGFIMAKERGHYKDVGLDVELLEYDNGDSIQKLVDGKIDLTISNTIVAFSDRRLDDVTLLATYLQRSPLVLITQPEIDSPIDLEGKRIMMSENNLHNSSLSILLAYYNIDAENTTFVQPTFKLDEFIAKEVDAMTAFRSNEVFELDELNISYNVIDPVEYAFSTNAINLFASHKKVEEDSEQIRSFLSASKKGWEYALAHIDETAQLIHEKYRPDRSLKLLQYEGRVTKELMLLDIYGIGEINREFVSKTCEQLVRSGKLDSGQDLDRLVFVPEANEQNGLSLTEEERKWLADHPSVTFTGDPNWLPFEAFDDDGGYIGIVSDHLALIEAVLPISFEKVVPSSWTDALNIAMEGKASIISGDASDVILNQKFDPIETYINNPIVIVMDHHAKYVDNLNEIAEKKIAIIKGYGSTADIYKKYRDIDFIEVENAQEGLLGVETGRFDAMLASLALASYTITQMGSDNLVIVGRTDIMMDVTLFVTKDEPLLHSIIDKAVKSIDAAERQKIMAKWRHVDTISRFDNELIWKLLLGTFVVFFFLVYRQRVLQRLNQKTERLKERMELALIGSKTSVLDWDLTDNSLYISPGWKMMLGFTDEELPNRTLTWKERVHRDDKKVVFSGFYKIKTDKMTHFENNHRLRHKDGHWVWILGRAQILYENGKAVRMVGTHTDITEEKEMQLKYAHQAQIIAQTHDSIISTDLEGIITSWNAGSESLLEYTAQEMIGKHIKSVYLPEDLKNLEKNIVRLKEDGEHHDVVRMLKRTQVIMFADLSLSLLKDDKGEAIGMVGYAQDITERIEAEEKIKEQTEILRHQAHYDGLTGLPNRELFKDRLSQAIISGHRNHKKVALLFIDLDHFKEINDSLGHHVGDEVLKQVSIRLQQQIRETDTIARLGGDEFTIILDALHDTHTIVDIIKELLDAMTEPIVIEEHQLYATLSIGATIYPDDSMQSNTLLKNADAAMYKAKEDGRNTYRFYTEEMTERAFERIVMASSLRQALEREEFIVYYQPQMNGETDELIGMEALVRWMHPLMGLVSPAKFIPLAEETGLIVEIDKYVIQRAIRQFSVWCDQGLDPKKAAINLSVKQLQQEDLVETLQKAFHESSCRPDSIEIEVTEGHVMKDPEMAIAILQQISDLGVSLAVDDFGTGYSSLAYLKRLPIDKLKIDQSFIRDLPDDTDDAAIVKTVITLSDNLGLSVIAEGVETEEQKDFLIDNGCRYIQGYLYGRPMDAEAMEKFIKENALKKTL